MDHLYYIIRKFFFFPSAFAVGIYYEPMRKILLSIVGFSISCYLLFALWEGIKGNGWGYILQVLIIAAYTIIAGFVLSLPLNINGAFAVALGILYGVLAVIGSNMDEDNRGSFGGPPYDGPEG